MFAWDFTNQNILQELRRKNVTVTNGTWNDGIVFANGGLSFSVSSASSYVYVWNGDIYGYDGSTIYKNGSSVGSQPLSLSASGFSESTGTLTMLIMFSRDITLAEITDIHNGTTFDYDDHLVHHWRMDEVNPRDWAGDADGTGVSITSSDIVEGIVGTDRAIEFDGSNDYINIPADGDIGEFTVVASALGSSSKPRNVVISRTDTYNPFGPYDNKAGFTLAIASEYGTRKLAYFTVRPNSGSGAYVEVSGDDYNDSFHVIGGSWTKTSPGFVYLFGDGQLLKSTAYNSSDVMKITNNYTIGRSRPNRNSNSLSGKCGVVLFYNKSLTNLQHADIAARIRRGDI